MTRLIFKKTGYGPGITGHIGTVKDVIAARLPPAITGKKLKASDFAYGFELATPREIASIGEAVVVGGNCYATSTDKDSSEYNTTISGPEFISGGLFLIPHMTKPSHHVEFPKGSGKLSFSEFFEEIFEEIQRPLAFIGFFHFIDFHGIAIGKPPIDGQNIFENKAKYFPNPEVFKSNVFCFAMGVVANDRDEKYADLYQELETVLYRNPIDTESKLIYHTHVLTLKKPLSEISEIQPDVVDKVLHLFNEGSNIDFIQASIFTIDTVKDFLNEY